MTRIAGSHIVSSSLEPDARTGRWRTTFPHPVEPCGHGCATCKVSAMQRLAAGRVTIFAGDGMSDRYAAAHADVVFAKTALAAFCGKASIAFTPFDALGTIANRVEQLLSEGLLQPLAGRVPSGV